MVRKVKNVNGSGADLTETEFENETGIPEFVAETLRGDVRDAVLREFKAMEKPWAQMNEKEQERLIHRAVDIAHSLTNSAIRVAAHRGFAYLVAGVKQFTVTDEIKTVVTCSATVENITKLAKHAGEMVCVLISPTVFFGEREKATPDVVGELKLPKGKQPQQMPTDSGVAYQ